MTPQEFQDKVNTLTAFQKRIFDAVEKGVCEMASRWDIARSGFAKEWTETRTHGALFRAFLQAGRAMEKKEIIIILPPETPHGDYTFSSRRKWCKEEPTL